MVFDIIFFGQFGFFFDDGSQKMVIDLFFSENLVVKYGLEDIVCQMIGLIYVYFDYMVDVF